VVGCGGGSSCDEVLSNRWSAVLGVLPISGLAAGAYLAMLVAGFFIGQPTESSVRRLAWRAILVLAAAAAGSAVWFTILQRWIIGSFCPYCMATHIVGLLLAGLVFWRAPKEFEPDLSSTNPKRIIGSLPATGFASIGLILAGALAACQMIFVPPPEYRGGETQDILPVINPHAAPIVGSPDAPYVVTLLYDYNCPHCQELHSLLEGAIRRYEGKLAFVLCPSPLNTQCNPYVPQDVDEFKNSCELAKISLAVWAAKPAAFATFDNWMFSFESGDRWKPRTPEAAKAKAVELVGPAQLAAALNDPRAGEYLKNCIRIYGATTTDGNNAVPKFVFGSRWVIPQPNNVDDLVSILRNTLSVPMPQPRDLVPTK